MKTAWLNFECSLICIQVRVWGFTRLNLKKKPKNPNKFALENADFVKRSILAFLGKDLIRECSQAPSCVNPLTVSVPANKKSWLILDLRHVNFFPLKGKVNFEGTKEDLHFAKKGNYMIKFDLTSGHHYHMISMEIIISILVFPGK